MREWGLTNQSSINAGTGVNLNPITVYKTIKTNLPSLMEAAEMDVRRSTGGCGYPANRSQVGGIPSFIVDVIDIPASALGFIFSKVDVFVIAAELGFVILVASVISRFVLSRSAQFHALKLAAMHSGLSLYECLGLTTSALALLAFDIFGATVEEDLMDSAAAAVLFFALASIFGVILSLNVFFVYALTPVSGGEQLRRILISDIMNFGLTILRVMLC
jgi:hypothetical protein